MNTQAFEEGYAAYEIENDIECPYSRDTDTVKWADWCDGNEQAYIDMEGK